MGVDSKNNKPEARGIQSVTVGSKLLEVLADRAKPLMLKDIANAVGLSPAKAHAYLVSYQEIGLVEQENKLGKYRLGAFAIDIGIARMRSIDAMQIANETAVQLTQNTDLNSAVSVWGGFGPTAILIQESGSQPSMKLRHGAVYSLTGSSTGRLFASYMPDELISAEMKREYSEAQSLWRIGESVPMSEEDKRKIRENGYATNVEPSKSSGISAYAAPVFDYTGALVMSLSIMGHERYIKEVGESIIISQLLKASGYLSGQLGWQSGINVKTI